VGNNSCVSYTMSFTVAPTAFGNDQSPNDDFSNPQSVALGVPFDGHLNFLYDNTSDIYGVTLPTDGMLRIIVSAEHAGTEMAGTIEVYVNVNNSYYYPAIGAQGVVETDTFQVRCIAAQLVTVRLQNANSNITCGVSYRVRFDHTPSVFVNDPLPNDDPTDPQPIVLNTPVEGHLDFFGDGTSDWYGLTLPDDGTLRVIAEAEQHDTISTGLVNVYVDQLNTSIQFPVGASSVAGLDTFYFNCVRAGLIKVAVQPANSDGCGISYRLRFELVPPAFGNDPEPNDGITEAVWVQPDTDQDGHLTYIGTSNNDYFKLWKDFAGTMRVVFASSTQGPSPALNVYIANTNSSQSITTGENGTVAYDTVLVYTANPDTIRMSVSAFQGTYCGSYRLHYESTPVGIDDNAAQNAEIQVFPNPSADGVFSLRSAVDRISQVDVFDVNGRSVLGLRSVAISHLTLDLSGLPSGIYAAQIRTGTGAMATARLITSH